MTAPPRSPKLHAELLRTMLVVGACAFSCTASSTKDSPPNAPGTATETGLPPQPPIAPVVHIEPVAPTTSDTLTYVVDVPATDPNNDALTWHAAWYVGGIEATDWTDSVPSSATAKDEVWELRVSVDDGLLSSETALDVVVIGNSPPEATVVIDPVVPTTQDRLRALPSGSDIDGDTYGFQIVWTVDGADAGITDPDVAADRTTAGETWTVTVTPIDSEPGAPATASVTIENSVPTVSDVDIRPTNARTDDTLEASFVAEDPDRTDVLTPHYAWTVNGVNAGSDATLASSAFVRDDTIGLSVAIDDGQVEGPARFASPIVIDNTPPSITDATLDPTTPGPTDDVVCVPGGWSDADGDAEGYIYAWTLDGQSGPTTNHWHLSTLELSGGETLTCTVAPDDGRDAGATIRVSTTIASP